MSLCNKLVALIRSSEAIHRWDLIDEAKVSIRDYNMIKSYLQHRFDHLIKYDKSNQMWIAISIPLEQKLEIQETIEDHNGKSS